MRGISVAAFAAGGLSAYAGIADISAPTTRAEHKKSFIADRALRRTI
jgi:hypothetical protein